MGMLDSIFSHFSSSPAGSSSWMDCPNCHERINLAMDRCPKCHTHIDSMFRIKCPKCKTDNKLRATKCEKCKTPLGLPGEGGGERGVEGGAPPRTIYSCPYCGFKADYVMSACPACGVRFV